MAAGAGRVPCLRGGGGGGRRPEVRVRGAVASGRAPVSRAEPSALPRAFSEPRRPPGPRFASLPFSPHVCPTRGAG